MKKIIGVILIIGGIFFASLAVKALVSAPQSYEKIRVAATIKDRKLTPENEGKLVVVSETLKPAEQLQDPITGVKLPGVTAKRTVWTYKQNAGSGNAGWNLLSGGKESRYCISKEHWLPKKSTGTYSTTGYGSQKVSYGIVSPDDPLEYTIIGVQKGDTLIKSEDVDSVTTFKGIMTAEEFAEENKKGVRGGSIFAIVAGILLAVIGAGMMIFRRQ